MRRLLFFLLLLVVASGALVASAVWWIGQPLIMDKDRVEFRLPRGTSVRDASHRITEAGVKAPPDLLYGYFRWAAQGRTIKSGEYEIERGITPPQLLDKLARGEQVVRTVTLVDGWTFRQVRQALDRAEHLRHDTQGMSAEEIMQALQRPDLEPEGRFFPDTYHYSRDSSDLDVLRQALELMDRNLAAAWEARAPDLPLASPDEVLVLASIVEKETGLASDRAEIAGVFVNRLRKGMMLQTDPTVIYGLGEDFDGRLTRRHLSTDTPFNTYTRHGLPPTPIALAGRASLMATVQPAQTPALYFVARGDGSSQFSQTLNEHNRAVHKYLRSGRRSP